MDKRSSFISTIVTSMNLEEDDMGTVHFIIVLCEWLLASVLVSYIP